jgi:hypothetical protein
MRGLEGRSSAAFDRLRSLAIKNHDWESLREAELFALKVDFDEERFQRLYFGTPFPGFRDIIALELGKRPSRQFFVLGKEASPCFDLGSGAIDGRHTINSGKKCHQLLEVLLRDFFRPQRIGGLFSELFPSERFNINSSPDRIRQIIRRTRRWFESQRIPVRIVESRGFYSIQIDGPFSFRVPLDRPFIHPYDSHLKKIEETFGDSRLFLAKDIQRQFALTQWMAREVLIHGMKRGLIQRLGDTKRDAKYQFVPKVQGAAA